jgi:hypothetical protein
VRAVVDKKRVQHHAVGAGENLRAQNVQAGGAQGPGDFAEQPRAVPGADFHQAVAAVPLVNPRRDRGEHALAFKNQPAHETVDQRHVLRDLGGRVHLEIPLRQLAEMRVQLLVGGGPRRQFADQFPDFRPRFFRGAAEFRAAGEQRHRLAMELPEQRVLEAVPELVAGALRIREGQQGQQIQFFRRADLPRKPADDRRVVEIAALRKGGHEQVVFDEEFHRVGGRRD